MINCYEMLQIQLMLLTGIFMNLVHSLYKCWIKRQGLVYAKNLLARVYCFVFDNYTCSANTRHKKRLFINNNSLIWDGPIFFLLNIIVCDFIFLRNNINNNISVNFHIRVFFLLSISQIKNLIYQIQKRTLIRILLQIIDNY